MTILEQDTGELGFADPTVSPEQAQAAYDAFCLEVAAATARFLDTGINPAQVAEMLAEIGLAAAHGSKKFLEGFRTTLPAAANIPDAKDFGGNISEAFLRLFGITRRMMQSTTPKKLALTLKAKYGAKYAEDLVRKILPREEVPAHVRQVLDLITKAGGGYSEGPTFSKSQVEEILAQDSGTMGLVAIDSKTGEVLGLERLEEHECENPNCAVPKVLEKLKAHNALLKAGGVPQQHAGRTAAKLIAELAILDHSGPLDPKEIN